MIPLLSSNVLLVSFPSVRNLAFSSSPTHFNLRFDFAPISQTRLFSSSIDVAKEVEKDDSFTVSYLINSCGLSPESAKSASELVQIKNPSNADSVLDCLKNYGFSDADIGRLVIKYPRVLTTNVEKILKPKMEFFLSLGVKGEDLVAIIYRSPNLLRRSLNKKLIPYYAFLKEVLVHDELVVKTLKNGSWFWKGDWEKNVVPNLQLLKQIGVSKSSFQSFLFYYFYLLTLDNAEFSKRVNRVIEMGFDPSKYMFSEAIRYLPTKSTWERKAHIFRSWGWSDSDIWLAFRKCPRFMQSSVEKITALMDFLVNKMGYDPSAIAACSFVFDRSLEKNIIPKCSVIRVLMLKGLIGEDFSFRSFIPVDKKRFLDRFVVKYLEQVPELLDIYEGEVDLSELGYEFEEKLSNLNGKCA